MDDCLKCGSALPPGAMYCPQCGRSRDGSGQKERAFPIAWAGITVVAFVMGGVFAAAMYGGFRGRDQTPQVRPTHPAIQAAARHHPAASVFRMAELPPGHPHVNMPSGHPGIPASLRISPVVSEAEKEAARKPDDIAAWNRYGDLAEHFAIFNPANYRKAQDAYAHVLKLAPANGDALRGIGDVYYDTHRYAKAIDAYNKYLRKTPGDSKVLTDLGTMYLSQHNNAAAISRYRTALAHKSDYFPAQFNLAVAYLLGKDNPSALKALQRARTIAPSGAARTRIDEMIARVEEHSARTRSNHQAAPALEPTMAKGVAD